MFFFFCFLFIQFEVIVVKLSVIFHSQGIMLINWTFPFVMLLKPDSLVVSVLCYLPCLDPEFDLDKLHSTFHPFGAIKWVAALLEAKHWGFHVGLTTLLLHIPYSRAVQCSGRWHQVALKRFSLCPFEWSVTCSF